MQQEEYMTVGEVATALRVSTVTVQTWCREGQLASDRIGRSYRIPREAFLAFQAKAKVGRVLIEVDQIYEAELSALVQAWQRDMEVGARPCSADTIATHRKHIFRFVKILIEAGAGAGGHLTFREAISEKAISRAMARIPIAMFATRYNVFMAVMSFSRFLVAQGLLEEPTRDAMKRHKPKRVTPPRRTALHSMDDVNRFFEALWMSEAHSTYEKTLNALVAGLMVFAGLRVGEVAGFELAHVDLVNRILYIHHGKGGKSRMVGVNPRLAELVEAYLKVRPGSESDRLVLSEKGQPLNREYLERRIRRIAKRAGLNVHAHGLRRTFATLNANAGRSIQLIQLALGHSSISTTQAYLMADQRTAAREMQTWH